MRTTLDIDQDVLQAAKELADQQGRSAGKIISELARKGMSPQGPRRSKPIKKNGVPLLRSRGEIVTLEKVRRIMEEEGV